MVLQGFTCYIMDKILSFESGRPSAIHDAACTVSPLAIGDCMLAFPNRRPVNVFAAEIGICQELSFISTNLFTRGSSKLSAVDALAKIGEADLRLQQWVESLPVEIRPHLDGNATEVQLLPYITRVHCMYFLASVFSSIVVNCPSDKRVKAHDFASPWAL